MEQTSVLAPEDDVLIVGMEDSSFHGKNGKVKAILPTGMVEVHFFKEFAYLFGHEYNQGKTTWEFDPKDLQKIILEEHPRLKANRLYNRRYNVLYELKYRFSPENDCMCEACPKKAVKRILFNFYGTVSEYDVCEVHASKDGYMGDSLETKPGYTPKVKELY